MSPVTHFLFGWLVASVDPELEDRDRALVAIAGVFPDYDGFGAVIDIASRWFSEEPTSLFHTYHHLLGHNIASAIFAILAAAILARRRALTALLVGISFHLHLLCDLMGSKGPDGSQWPIPYLLPFSDAWQLTWKYQWQLNAWPNLLITGICLIITFELARRRGYSPLGMLSKRADRAFVGALRARLGCPSGTAHESSGTVEANATSGTATSPSPTKSNP